IPYLLKAAMRIRLKGKWEGAERPGPGEVGAEIPVRRHGRSRRSQSLDRLDFAVLPGRRPRCDGVGERARPYVSAITHASDAIETRRSSARRAHSFDK